MKNIIPLAIALVAICLLISGCAQPQAETLLGAEQAAAAEEPAEEEPAPEAEEPAAEEPEEEEPAPEEPEEDVASALTQEELDQLKADLEGMEFEDLGGLSE
ncbi:MAG: hypothetical protein ABIB71_09110 [Candidatus Woesearchaeota archaeon]